METNELIKGIKEDIFVNYELYCKLVEKYPHMKYILEDVLYTNPRYALHYIREEEKSIVFFFYQSMALYMGNYFHAQLLNIKNVSIQYPGNQDYSFSVNIDK
jgi:hypothetical protein